MAYGACPDVRRTDMKPENKMESLFLGETLKYMYSIFDEEDTKLDWHKSRVFTTEAHVGDASVQ